MLSILPNLCLEPYRQEVAEGDSNPPRFCAEVVYIPLRLIVP